MIIFNMGGLFQIKKKEEGYLYIAFGTQLVKIKLKYNPLPQCTFVNVSFLFPKLFKILYCFIYGAFQISIRNLMWPPHGDQLLNTLRIVTRYRMRALI